MPVRRGPRQPFGMWRDEFDRLVADIFRGLPASLPEAGVFGGRGFPAANVWETDDEFCAELEVPGLKEDDINIFVVGTELTIKGERREPESNGGTFHRRERSVGAFTRVVHLPGDVDSDRVEASLKDGVLLIKLPKSEAAKPRKIQVSSSGK